MTSISTTKKKTNYLFLFFFTALCLTSLPTKDEASGSTAIQYIIIVIFLVLAVFGCGLKPLLNKALQYNFIDAIPILIFFVWLYGVFVGLIRNVPSKYVFRNFGGMVFYFIFYFLYIIKLDFRSVFKSIRLNSFLGIPVIFYLTYMAFTEGAISRIGGERVVFCFLQLIIFIPFVIYFGNAFFPIGDNKKIFFARSSIGIVSIIILSYFSSVLISFSKGMILASFIIMLMIFGMRIYRGLSYKITIRIILFILVILGLLAYFDLFKLLDALFSSREESNATRSLQSVYLLDDLTFFGRGLGAGLTNVNYVRAADAPYAFELTYLNLLHKFGFVALLLFFIYIYTFVKIFQLFGKDTNQNFIALICLGLMAYVFPSIGNPFLLSPLGVVCHVLCLYLLKLNKITPYRG